MSLEARVHVERGGFVLHAALMVASGATVSVVGPNGAGKSTLLHAIAGLVPLASGRVSLGDQVLCDVGAGTSLPAERRRVGLVFHDRLLFPHLSAHDNVAFAARCRGASRNEAATEARAWLTRVGADEVAERRPDAMSAGQQQRVALARALAARPDALLLDEPLAAVDARGRVDLRRLVAAQLAEFQGPCIVVTHDPVEAMSLASQLVVLEAGAIVQRGTVSEVAAHPASAYVAEFLGVNLYRGVGDGERVVLDSGLVLVTATRHRGPVTLTIHPRSVAVHQERPTGSPRNVWPGVVAAVERAPGATRVRIDDVGTGSSSGRGPQIVAEVTDAAVTALGLHPGARVWAAVKAVEVSVHPA